MYGDYNSYGRQQTGFILSTHQFGLKWGLVSNHKTELSFFKFTDNGKYMASWGVKRTTLSTCRN